MRKFIRDLGPKHHDEDNPENRSILDRGDHPGLILQRYLAEQFPPDSDNSPQAKEQKKRALAERTAIFHSSINAAKNKAKSNTHRDLYRAAFNRWIKSLQTDLNPVEHASLVSQSRLIVGLGSENVLETGIRLHHTYGMPIIPGSALKGLAAHYCDQVWGERDDPNPPLKALEFRNSRKEDKENQKEAESQGKHHQFFFGTTDDGGCITFHDAWYDPDSPSDPLVPDVMTPHHPGWNDIKKLVPPTDFDSPIPVSFLSVTGTFHIAVSWNGPTSDEAKKWTSLAFFLLCNALFDWGVGGKTSSGYGRFDREKFEKAKKEREDAEAKLRLEEEEQTRLAAMSPIERSISEFLKSHTNAQSPDFMKLLEELRKNSCRWISADDRREVAERVKQGMIKANKWEGKKKDAEQTKFIKNVLGE